VTGTKCRHEGADRMHGRAADAVCDQPHPMGSEATDSGKKPERVTSLMLILLNPKKELTSDVFEWQAWNSYF